MKEKFVGGHHHCPGCAEPIIVRAVLDSINKPVIAVIATSCLEVTTTLYPYTSWRVPVIHNAFENAAPTASGIASAISQIHKKKLAHKFPGLTPETMVVVFAGDGATYDIGFGALSGAWERNDNFLYVCLNNEAYRNTGHQRSSATPLGSQTTTTPLGKKKPVKDITKIALAHHIPYLAQASAGCLDDLSKKTQKAAKTKGAKFINVLSPCVPGWGYDTPLTIELAQLATETGIWPLWEAKNNQIKINQPKEKLKPISMWLIKQKRFKHLFQPQEKKEELKKIQKMVNDNWQELQNLAKIYMKTYIFRKKY